MTLVAWVLIVLAAVDWVVTALLIHFARVVDEPALTERASASIILTAVASSIAIVSGAYIAKVKLGPTGDALFITGLMLVSLPQLVWLVLHLRRYFR